MILAMLTCCCSSCVRLRLAWWSPLNRARDNRRRTVVYIKCTVWRWLACWSAAELLPEIKSWTIFHNIFTATATFTIFENLIYKIDVGTLDNILWLLHFLCILLLIRTNHTHQPFYSFNYKKLKILIIKFLANLVSFASTNRILPWGTSRNSWPNWHLCTPIGWETWPDRRDWRLLLRLKKSWKSCTVKGGSLFGWF